MKGIIYLLAISFAMLSSCAVKCPNGTKVRLNNRYLNPIKQYSRDYESKVGITLKILNKAEISIGSNYKNKVHDLHEKLNQDNANVLLLTGRLETLVRLRPCDSLVAYKYLDFITTLTDKTFALRQMELEVEKLSNAPDTVFIRILTNGINKNDSLTHVMTSQLSFDQTKTDENQQQRAKTKRDTTNNQVNIIPQEPGKISNTFDTSAYNKIRADILKELKDSLQSTPIKENSKTTNPDDRIRPNLKSSPPQTKQPCETENWGTACFVNKCAYSVKLEVWSPVPNQHYFDLAARVEIQPGNKYCIEAMKPGNHNYSLFAQPLEKGMIAPTNGSGVLKNESGHIYISQCQTNTLNIY